VASTFSSIQLWTTVVVLILAPLVFGSVDLFWVAVWTILLSISTLCGVGVRMQTGLSCIFYAFLGLCGVYGIVSIIQVVPLGLDQLNDPSWQLADELLGLGVLPRISSRAEIPPLAAGHFLLFVTSLVSVREHLESSESFVIQGWRSDLKGRRCGRRRTAVVTTEAGYAIRAI
jgi:hypothetical protein